jgi:hypothetical protein
LSSYSPLESKIDKVYKDLDMLEILPSLFLLSVSCQQKEYLQTAKIDAYSYCSACIREVWEGLQWAGTGRILSNRERRAKFQAYLFSCASM